MVNFTLKLNPIGRAILFLLFLSTNQIINAQEVKTTIQVNAAINYTLGVNLSLKEYTISIKEVLGDFTSTIVVSDFDSQILYDFVRTSHEKNKKANLSPAELTSLKSKTNLKFIELLTGLYNTGKSGQKIAMIKVNSNIPVYDIPDKVSMPIHFRVQSKLYKTNFNIKDCQIVFEDGFIKSIIASGDIGGKNITFSNQYGIGLTTRNNIRKLSKNILFNEHDRSDNRTIRVGDLLNYSRILGNRTNDFSPMDQTITLFANQGERTLSKSPKAKLFTLSIFSDFAGINQDNPNGLIQTELSKRINFWTQRTGLWKFGGMGIFTHVIPSAVLTKIENKNKNLPIERILENLPDTTYYISLLENFRHNIARIGTEINLIDIEGAALNVHFNGIFGAGISRVEDELIQEGVAKGISQNLNSLYWGGVGKLLFNPESSWSFQFSDQLINFQTLSDDFQFQSIENGKIRSANKAINTLEFLAAWTNIDGNKLFARYRFNHELKYSNNNFSEYQLGYSIFLKSSRD